MKIKKKRDCIFLKVEKMVQNGEIQDSQRRPYMVSPPQMPVPLKRMYNANILRAEITTFVPNCPPM